ncbi:hypothetical protein [Methylomicrobium sp. Wu6]|uniref:hypothetical protein n=1 Tax=Methylomicrobium sp. Wu6 TaxID=3107928 RepID=UPI002DD69087|nr:hypothetical protein [Methylomicrobium sp. Wu6]MEC4747354.1 hypothetical protein [Methylomicrobium sp. Wu6]
MHGLKLITLLGDSGGNQAVQKRTGERLSAIRQKKVCGSLMSTIIAGMIRMA